MILSRTLLILGLGLALITAGPAYGQKKKKKGKETVAEENSTTNNFKNIGPKEKEASESFFIEGMKFTMLEDYAKALERFQKSYAIDPKNAALNYKLAETIRMMGRDNEALTFAQSAVNLDGNNPYYYLLLAQLFSSQQRYEEATKTLVKLIKDVPHTEQYLFNLADLYLAQNKYDDAIKTYDRIEKQYGFIDEIAFKKQQIYLRQNNLEKALKQGEQLITSDPNDIRYTLAQAEMLANNKKTDQAIELIQKALKADANNAQAHLLLSDLYRQKGNLLLYEQELKLAFTYPGVDIDTKVKILLDYLKQIPNPPATANPALQKMALELADLTIKIHPQEAKAFAIAGDLQYMLQKKADSRANLLKAIKLDNSKFLLWQQVANIDLELNQPDSLLLHTDKALELFPNQSVLWLYNGTGYILKKNHGKAIKSLEYGKKLASDNPEMQTQFNIQLGDSYHSLKEYIKSDAAYETVLLTDPNNAHVLNNYSYYLSLRNQNLQKARSMAERLVKQYPKDATYLDTYAWVLYKLKDYTGARKFLEEAVALKKDADILEHYGDVLFQLGQKEEAIVQWQKAKQTGKSSELIDKKIKDKKLYE